MNIPGPLQLQPPQIIQNSPGAAVASMADPFMNLTTAMAKLPKDVAAYDALQEKLKNIGEFKQSLITEVLSDMGNDWSDSERKRFVAGVNLADEDELVNKGATLLMNRQTQKENGFKIAPVWGQRDYDTYMAPFKEKQMGQQLKKSVGEYQAGLKPGETPTVGGAMKTIIGGDSPENALKAPIQTALSKTYQTEGALNTEKLKRDKLLIDQAKNIGNLNARLKEFEIKKGVLGKNEREQYRKEIDTLYDGILKQKGLIDKNISILEKRISDGDGTAEDINNLQDLRGKLPLIDDEIRLAHSKMNVLLLSQDSTPEMPVQTGTIIQTGKEQSVKLPTTTTQKPRFELLN